MVKGGKKSHLEGGKIDPSKRGQNDPTKGLKWIFTYLWHISLSYFSYFEEQQRQQPVAMVSRRKILSRSRDDLNLDCSDSFRPGENKEEEDVWYAKEKLYKVRIETKGSHFPG